MLTEITLVKRMRGTRIRLAYSSPSATWPITASSTNDSVTAVLL